MFRKLDEANAENVAVKTKLSSLEWVLILFHQRFIHSVMHSRDRVCMIVNCHCTLCVLSFQWHKWTEEDLLVSYQWWRSQAGPLRPQSGNLPRLGRIHENSHLEDRLQLFRCTASNQEYTAYRLVLLSLVTSLILSRLDYGSVTLAGVPGYLLDRLQSVLHASARLVNQARKHDPVSSLLWDLHWLWVPERIKYRLVVLVYRCHIHTAPEYLARDLHWVADDDSRRRLRSSTT